MVIWDVAVLEYVEVNFALVGTVIGLMSVLLCASVVCMYPLSPWEFLCPSVLVWNTSGSFPWSVLPIKAISVVRHFSAMLLCNSCSTFFMPKLVFFPQLSPWGPFLFCVWMWEHCLKYTLLTVRCFLSWLLRAVCLTCLLKGAGALSSPALCW